MPNEEKTPEAFRERPEQTVSGIMIEGNIGYNACLEATQANQLRLENLELREALYRLLDSIDPLTYPNRDWRNEDFNKKTIGSISTPSDESVLFALEIFTKAKEGGKADPSLLKQNEKE